jgi:hypothetical protein
MPFWTQKRRMIVIKRSGKQFENSQKGFPMSHRKTLLRYDTSERSARVAQKIVVAHLRGVPIQCLKRQSSPCRLKHRVGPTHLGLRLVLEF